MRNIIKITSKAITSIILILNCNANIKAQTYMGYLGKRNLVNLNLHIGMSPFPQSNRQRGLLITNFNTKIEAEVERSLNSKFSLGSSIRYTHSTFNTGKFNTVLFATNERMYFYSNAYSGEAKLNQVTFGGYLKKFFNKNGGFSPSGKYFQAGINYHIVSVKDPSLYFLKRDQFGSFQVSEIKTISSCNYISYLIGLGNQKVFKRGANMYVINTEIYANIPQNYLVTIVKMMTDSEDAKTIDIAPTIKTFLAEFDFVSVKLGIGYLF